MAVRSILAAAIGVVVVAPYCARADRSIPQSATATVPELVTPTSQPATALPATALPATVSRLLQSGESYSPRALIDARREYQRLEQTPSSKAWVRYALVLVLIKQRAFDEVLVSLDEIVADQPDLLPVWRTKIWTEMAARKHGAAVKDMRTLAELISRQSESVPVAAEQDDRRTAAFFMGRAFAFLESARSGTIPAADLRCSKQNVMSKLGELCSAFGEGEESFSADLGRAAVELSKSEAVDTAARERAEQDFKQQQLLVDKAEAKVEYETEKLKTEVAQDLDRLGKEAEAIQKDMLKGQFNLNTVDQAIMVLQQRLTLQSLQRGSQRDPGAVVWNQNSVRRLFAQRAVIAEQMAELATRLNVVAVRREALLAQGLHTAGKLKAKTTHLQHEGKKLQFVEKLRPKNKQNESQQSRTLRQQKQTFRNYEPFPFEQERDRVLTALKDN